LGRAPRRRLDSTDFHRGFVIGCYGAVWHRRGAPIGNRAAGLPRKAVAIAANPARLRQKGRHPCAVCPATRPTATCCRIATTWRIRHTGAV
jgi:hypothetical protein